MKFHHFVFEISTLIGETINKFNLNDVNFRKGNTHDLNHIQS